MDSMEQIYAAGVDAYTDMVMDIVDSDESRADKRAKIRDLFVVLV